MTLALITIKQVVVLFILILAGVICVKTGAVKMEGKKAFSDLLLYLVVPAMVINSYLVDFNSEILKNIMITFGLSFILIMTGFAITMMLTMKQKDKNLPIMRFACVFSNAAYMGFPLIQALYGSEGLIYASAFVTVFNILLWTIGYAMVSRKVQIKEVIHTIVTTPVLISVVIGIVIYICQVPVPSVIKQPISLIGNMNTPLSMFITGMLIAGSSMKKLFENKQIFYTIIIRMLIIPVVCFGIFALLGLNGITAEVALLLEACPSAAITSVFAVQFQYDENLAAGSVVFTTFLSIIMLPLWAMCITIL